VKAGEVDDRTCEGVSTGVAASAGAAADEEGATTRMYGLDSPPANTPDGLFEGDAEGEEAGASTAGDATSDAVVGSIMTTSVSVTGLTILTTDVMMKTGATAGAVGAALGLKTGTAAGAVAASRADSPMPAHRS